jgi:hypothetical protein
VVYPCVMKNTEDELSSQASRVATEAGKTIRAAVPWLLPLARVGLAAKGVVYLVIGMIAMRLASGTSGARPDAQTAFHWLSHGPFGTMLLLVVALGLFFYAAWRFAEAAFGPDADSIKRRVVYAGQGVANAVLAFGALSQLQGRSSGGDSARRLSGEAMDWPGGEFFVGAVGIALVATGVWQFVRAWRGDATKHLDLSGLGAQAQDAISRLGAAGLMARGVSFGLIGSFLGYAALRQDAGKAKGPGRAIASLLQWPYGRELVAIVALGLLAYGLFMFVEAARRRITPLA